MAKKLEAKVRMGLFPVIGRFLFAGFFIFSGFKLCKDIITDDKVRKELTTMMVSILNFQAADSPEHKKKLEHFWVHVFVAICASCKAMGGLLILFDKIAGAIDVIFSLLISTSVRCFYYYKSGEPEFIVFLQGFMQNMTLFGALLLYIEMKMTIRRRQSEKRAPKSKKA